MGEALGLVTAASFSARTASRGKYYKTANTARQTARQALVDRLAQVIETHPLYSGATAILTVPGSAGNYQSFGELLTGAVGRKVRKQVVLTTPKGAHAPRKEGGARGLVGGLYVADIGVRRRDHRR